MKKQRVIFKCLFCSRESEQVEGEETQLCSCLMGERKMDNMDDVAATIRDLRARMVRVEADVYNIIQGIQSGYEKLLNRIKCLECHRCDINKTEDIHAKE